MARDARALVAILLMVGGGVVRLVPGFPSGLGSSDVHERWQSSASPLAAGAVPVVLAATTGTCAVLTLISGEPVHGLVVLGGCRSGARAPEAAAPACRDQRLRTGR